MKHSWQELADGTAECRRCPAVRTTTTKVTRVRKWLEISTDGSTFEHTEHEHGAAVEVTDAHPHKCRPTEKQ